jgi:hypothetical protein
MGWFPASTSAHCRQHSSSLLREIIEFRGRGGDQHLVRISIEHQPEWDHFDLQFSIGPTVEIDRADGISGFAGAALPAFEQGNVAVPESLFQGIEVGFDLIGNCHHILLFIGPVA